MYTQYIWFMYCILKKLEFPFKLQNLLNYVEISHKLNFYSNASLIFSIVIEVFINIIEFALVQIF